MSDRTATPPRFEDLPELLTPEEVQLFLRISRNICYELLRTNAIKCLRFGRPIRIPKSALLESGK